MLKKKMFPIPRLHSGSSVAEVRDITNCQIFGGMLFGNICITNDQLRALREWLPVENENTDNKTLEGAGNNLNLIRTVEQHGLRLMAFLAGRGLLEENRDPVLSLADMLYDFLEEEVVDLSEEVEGEEL